MNPTRYANPRVDCRAEIIQQAISELVEAARTIRSVGCCEMAKYGADDGGGSQAEVQSLGEYQGGCQATTNRKGKILERWIAMSAKLRVAAATKRAKLQSILRQGGLCLSQAGHENAGQPVDLNWLDFDSTLRRHMVPAEPTRFAAKAALAVPLPMTDVLKPH
ncbi:MAG TPA: hypothetical protein VFE33_31150 [Thermoanaerobaculia bacterium]|nr:hypothetical protein [Thermoanaerobaculia bacterium]